MVFTPDLETHKEALRWILRVLEDAGLKISVEKSEFAKKELNCWDLSSVLKV